MLALPGVRHVSSSVAITQRLLSVLPQCCNAPACEAYAAALLRALTWCLRLQVIQEVFCWTRNPMEVRRLAARKEEIYRELLGDRMPLVPSGLQKLMDTLNTHTVGHAHRGVLAVVRGEGDAASTHKAEAVHAALHAGTQHLLAWESIMGTHYGHPSARQQ